MLSIKNRLLNFIVISIVSCAFCGCAFNIRTPTVINYQKLFSITPESCKNDVEVLLGTPQGTGVHVINGDSYPLIFYYGLAGCSTLSSMQCDSGTAIISHNDNVLQDVIYFASKMTGPAIMFDRDLSITRFSEKTVVGQTKIQSLHESIGSPDYTGKRFNKNSGIEHDLSYYDASQIQAEGGVKEKWLMVGYDGTQTIQDIIWVSSFPEDIQKMVSVSKQEIKNLFGIGFIPEIKSADFGTTIDSVQVDALIKMKPKNINQIKSILGNPTAVGMKRFSGQQAMILSSWSYSKIDLKGTDYNFIPFGIEESKKESVKGQPFLVMDIALSRLLIGHDEDGSIKEIIWIKPWASGS